jgi:hypothetical protein
LTGQIDEYRRFLAVTTIAGPSPDAPRSEAHPGVAVEDRPCVAARAENWKAPKLGPTKLQRLPENVAAAAIELT